MLDYQLRHDLARDDRDPAAPRGLPGKSTLTSKLPAPIIFRLVSDERGGARDARGVAEGAEVAVDRAAASSGAPLPDALRERFESTLDADLSGVRVHTGADSARAASAIGAHAFTVGQDIHFGEGKFDPCSSFGVHLLAHEVAHTAQQQGAAPTRQHKLEVSTSGDAAEVEADRAADAMVAGVPFALGGAAAPIARKDDPAASGGGDKKDEPKPKFPSYNGSTETLSLPLGAGTAEFNFNEKSPSAKFGFKGEAEHKFLDFDKTMTPAPTIAPGVVLDVGVKAKAGIGVTGEAFASAGWEDAPGPTVEPLKQFVVKAGGGGKVALGLEGGVNVGVGVGVPMGYISGGAGFSLSAEASMSASLIAGGTKDHFGAWSGNVQLIVAGSAKLEAKGTLYVDAVITGDRYNLYTYELGSHEIATASITCIAMVDLATGKATDLPPVTTFAWNGLPQGKKVKTRKLSEQEKAALLPVNDGASGAPGHIPDEVPCENDGAGGAASDCGPPPAPPAERPAPAPTPAPQQDDGGGGAGGAGNGGDGAHGAPGY